MFRWGLLCKEGEPFKPRDPSTVTRRMKRFVQRAGLPDVSPHDLRHTCASLLLSSGADIVLLHHKGNCEHSALACFLFGDLQAVAVTILHNVARSEFEDVANPQAQVSFQHKGGGYSFALCKPCRC